MKLSHITITMPKGQEDTARKFYVDLLNLKEIPKPEELKVRGGIWLDAGGIDIHISIEEKSDKDSLRHFGLETDNIEKLKLLLESNGVSLDPGRSAPWKRFFVHDPFGNRIEIHEQGAIRA